MLEPERIGPMKDKKERILTSVILVFAIGGYATGYEAYALACCGYFSAGWLAATFGKSNA